MPRKFFQSLPVPCGVSSDVISLDVTNSREKRNQGQFDFLRRFPDVTDSREKINQGQSDFLRQKIW